MTLGGNRMDSILCGSDAMWEAFASDFDKEFCPLYRGLLLQPEGGITRHSLDNIRKLAAKLGETPHSVFCRNGGYLLFVFEKRMCYLASGFAVGYGGTAPSLLVEAACEFGFGDERDVRRRIFSLPENFSGNIFQCANPIIR